MNGVGENRTASSGPSPQSQGKSSGAFEHLAALVRQADSADPATRSAALDQLYRETASYAYKVAARWVQDPNRIDELVADAYEVVVVHIGAVREPRTFLRWLERIINSLGRARAAQRYQWVSLEDLLVELEAGEDDLSRRTGDWTAVHGEGTEGTALRWQNDAGIQANALGLLLLELYEKCNPPQQRLLLAIRDQLLAGSDQSWEELQRGIQRRVEARRKQPSKNPGNALNQQMFRLRHTAQEQLTSGVCWDELLNHPELPQTLRGGFRALPPA
jgi:DNA-directed RNA polymerase specialized sigma24 family protein